MSARDPAARDPVVMRVLPEHRDDRGRYWRPQGWGYTDDLEEAGMWEPNDAPRADRAVPIPLTRAIIEDGT